MKWYWIILIALVATWIGYMVHASTVKAEELGLVKKVVNRPKTQAAPPKKEATVQVSQ